MYWRADHTWPTSSMYSKRERRVGSEDIVSLSPTIARWRLALVTATLIRLLSAKNPTSPVNDPIRNKKTNPTLEMNNCCKYGNIPKRWDKTVYLQNCDSFIKSMQCNCCVRQDLSEDQFCKGDITQFTANSSFVTWLSGSFKLHHNL